MKKKIFSDSTGSKITFGMHNVKRNFSSEYKANIYLANKLGMFFLQFRNTLTIFIYFMLEKY